MAQNQKLMLGPFVPPQVKQAKINYTELETLLGKELQYATRGRHAIFHILKALRICRGVIIPAYSCPTIRTAIEAANLPYYYCDISEQDLNIDFESFIKVHQRTNADCVIVPSLYGNPANLEAIEEYCQQHGVKMIDDAAQSFGAKLNDKYLTSFGDGGLFAFSPGKSTPSAMGALFWFKGEYTIKRTKHNAIHKLIHLNYAINRRDYYSCKCSDFLKKLLNLITIYTEILVSIRNDKMADFEEGHLGGIIAACLNGELTYRNDYFDEFLQRFGDKGWFRIVLEQRGKPVHHKIVIVLKTKELTHSLRQYLRQEGIHTFGGYFYPDNCGDCYITESVVGKIVEIPIENDKNKMEHAFQCINKFFIEKEE